MLTINIAETDKVPLSTIDLTSNKVYSFLNLSSISSLFSNTLQEGSITYFCDGISTALLFRALSGKFIRRVSFDNTSLAPIVFEKCQADDLKIYFIGATESEIQAFSAKLMKKYKSLKIAGLHSGYWDETEEKSIIESVLGSGARVVVAGLGAGKQEQFLLDLALAGYSGISFTCGGFIRQEASTAEENYYPAIVNKLNLRFAYRAIKEPHTIKRYLFEYPKNLVKLLWAHLSSKLKFSFENI